MMYCTTSPKPQGFTLVEIAVGLVIISLVISGFITPISSLRENAKQKEAQQLLTDAHDALIGFAISNSGRLPCPATNGSNGLEALSGANCQQTHGFLPGVTLGLNGRYGENNLLSDPWGNPYRYSFSNSADLQICTQSGCPNAASVISTALSAVFLSTGKDGGTSSSSADQQENTDSDRFFVKHEPREGTNTAYDDQVYWLSPYTLSLHLNR